MSRTNDPEAFAYGHEYAEETRPPARIKDPPAMPPLAEDRIESGDPRALDDEEVEWEGDRPGTPRGEDPIAPQRHAVLLASGAGAGAGLLLIAVLGLLLLGSPGPATSAPAAAAAPAGGASGTPLYEAPAVGYRAPPFALTGLDNKTLSLQQFRGHPVWVNIWATWCPPCRAEMPEMKKLYARYKDQGLVILGVDIAENHDTVASFVQQNGYDWTFLLDSNSQVSQQYHASGIPTHAFVDSTGVIRAYQIGGLSADTMVHNVAAILPK